MFVPDSRTERFLDRLGLKWRYTDEMTFQQLNRSWETENLGRASARVEEAVKEYLAMRRSGSMPPACILWRNPATGKYDVADGVQRLLAAKPDNPVTFSAYIIETDSPNACKKIRVMSNKCLQGGHQESSEWSLAQAVRLLINDSLVSPEEVAELGGWTLAQVQDKQKCMNTMTKISSIGGPEQLPDTMLRIVAANAQANDFAVASQPIAVFFNELRRTKLKTEDAEPYIAEFFTVARTKGKIHDQFVKKLAEFREDEDIAMLLANPGIRIRAPMTPEGKLAKALKSTLSVVENVLSSGTKIPAMEEYFHMLGQIKKVMQQIEQFSKRGGRGK